MKAERKYSIAAFRLTPVMLVLLTAYQARAVDFNTDVLDSADRQNIDLSRFSQAGYIMPGHYPMMVMVNGQGVAPAPFEVEFIVPAAKDKTMLPQACLTQDVVGKMGLTDAAMKTVTWWHNGTCADLSALSGMAIHPEPGAGNLNISMPQAWLEYSDATWLPPSRWDNGIPGLLLDYNVNANVNHPSEGADIRTYSYYGTTGANMGPWRLRADYQGSRTEGGQSSMSQFDWSRFYLFRALPAWRSTLSVGENYISSDIFSSWRYSGMSLESDDRMLPPKLRGYAPQVSGVADTNARVVVSQQGRVLYDTTVPAGPFTIQDLDSSVRGTLDVKVVEQNGQTKTFQVTTNYVPYLTRPGQIRYRLAGGRSRSEDGHNTEGPAFTGGEVSWGINNQWSLYGGGIIAGEYNSLALGAGHDLNQFGTVSADVTQSVATFDNGHQDKKGKSWRVSYSKHFDDANADVTFAGYRFTEKNFMTMQQFLNARYRDDFSGRQKELYTVSLNKNFEDYQTSVSLQYSYQTYWDQAVSNYYTLTLNRYFDAFGLKGISAGLAASRSEYYGRSNDSAYLTLSVPLSNGYLSYNSNLSQDRLTQTVGYSSTLNDGLDNYTVSAGLNSGDNQPTESQFSGYYSHRSELADLSANASVVEHGYSSFGMTASGGMTLTPEGAALHAGGMNGGTRLLVDTDGVADVPVDGGRTTTNRWGIGVVTDVSSYYRNTTSVDLNHLPDDMEATRSVVESALTEGAIGYRRFEVLRGARLFAVLNLTDGSHPPFGASVTNDKQRELGMVSDGGLAWLTGITAGETLSVSWDGQVQCRVSIPKALARQQQLLLPCKHVR